MPHTADNQHMPAITAPPPIFNTPETSNPTDSPFAPEQQQQLAQANRRAKTILAASKVATINVYSCGTFAALSLFSALFNPYNAIIGTVLATLAYNEARGRKHLRAFNPAAPGILASNQLAFLATIIIYSLWCILAALTGPNPYEQYINQTPELESALRPIVALHVSITMIIYSSVITASALIQGLTARYYLKRSTLLKNHLAETPDWIIEMQRISQR